MKYWGIAQKRLKIQKERKRERHKKEIQKEREEPKKEKYNYIDKILHLREM